MTLKQFNADVAAAKGQTFRGVSSIRRGDSDGEVIFNFQPEWLSSSLDIQALTPDPDLYPSKSSFIVFTTTELKEDGLESTLEKLSAACGSKTVSEVISFISCALAEEPESCTFEAPECTDSEEAEYDSDDENDGLASGVLSDNQLFGLTTNPQRFGDGITERRLRQDLDLARSTGLRIGVFKGPSSRYPEAISLSIRASKLGIAEDSLEAWGLRASDYLVLLIAFPRGYPLPEEYIELPCNQVDIQLRFGKCLHPKPSLESARRALITDPRTHRKEERLVQRAESAPAGSGKDDFLPVRMSQAIDSLLNEKLPGLIHLRQANKYGWDEAQAQLFRHNRSTTNGDQQPQSHAKLPAVADDFFMITKDAPEALGRDFAMDKMDAFNIPLVCMQFALRRFARCTQYCMVCHQRMPGGFDALKPYVCSDELCLYQFLSLGLGTSLEHEIVHNPFVVDLLISFFYAALNNKGLREFPRGLGFKAFFKSAAYTPGDYLEGEACISDNRLRFTAINQEFKAHFRVGSLFLMAIRNMPHPTPISISSGECRAHYCRAIFMADTWCEFEILSTNEQYVQPHPSELINLKSSSSNPGITYSVQAADPFSRTKETAEWCKVVVFVQKHELDELENEDRDIALILLTKRIPRVLDMRAYLTDKPGRRLDTMDCLDSSVLSLLRWIVASNTSLVVQDEQVPEPDFSRKKDEMNAQKVQGLEPDWMQFRFAQGSPDKEQRFMEALKTFKDRNSIPPRYPTLFAWHGSPVGNWHSIIRSGLDFQSQLHGRAFGNGVYFSHTMDVSLGFSTRGLGAMSMVRKLFSDNLPFGQEPGSFVQGIVLTLKQTGCWPNSQLNITSAISICEIINHQDSFVSKSPYYVVNKTEWIQCRYLFVQVQPTHHAYSQPLPESWEQTCDGYLKLCPEIRGLRDKTINIPRLALPASRRHDFEMISGGKDRRGSPSAKKHKSANKPIYISDDDEDRAELSLLTQTSDNGRDETSKADGKRCWDHEFESMSVSLPMSKVRITTKGAKIRDVQPQQVSRKITSFLPGTLDLDSLPRLPEPVWASSTTSSALRNLGREAKQLQKLQSSSAPDVLGWYINFDKLNNIFHWIVELHSFSLELPLGQDMEKIGCKSVVLELRFGSSFPFSPPFVRVIRPRFKLFAEGGGGHVTAGGAICSELLTNSGWSPALSIDKVFLDVRLRLSDVNPPARLAQTRQDDYGIIEAAEAYRRAVRSHGWEAPQDLEEIVKATWA